MKKLVRDEIVEIIKSKGENCEYYIAEVTEHIKRLIDKLHEESQEVKDAKTNEEMMAEIGDLLDVIDKLCELKGFDIKDIDILRKNKTKNRGGFDKGIILCKY